MAQATARHILVETEEECLSLKEQIESDAMQVVKCSSTTLYKEFAFNLLKNNLFNPLNIIFVIIGFYTYFLRNDMRELNFIVRKLR